jgi:hypothetical protein
MIDTFQKEPEVSGVLLGPNGSLCKPVNSEVDLRVGLYGPGVARVDGGFVVCGGAHKTENGKSTVNRRCWFWSERERRYMDMPSSELDIDERFQDDPDRVPDGSILMANDFGGKDRNQLFVFVQGSTQLFSGRFLPDWHRVGGHPVDDRRHLRHLPTDRVDQGGRGQLHLTAPQPDQPAEG